MTITLNQINNHTRCNNVIIILIEMLIYEMIRDIQTDLTNLEWHK